MRLLDLCWTERLFRFPSELFLVDWRDKKEKRFVFNQNSVQQEKTEEK